jgi:hypothetical protein
MNLASKSNSLDRLHSNRLISQGDFPMFVGSFEVSRRDEIFVPISLINTAAIEKFQLVEVQTIPKCW